MKESMGWKTVVVAFFITSAIFLVGFGSAIIFNEWKVAEIESDYTSLSEDLESLELEEKYIASALPEKKCDLIGIQIQRLSNSLHETGKKLAAYKASKELTTEFDTLKRKYALLEVRTWMLAMENREQCNSDTVDIFYVYGLDQYDSSQGYVLDFFKERIGQKLLVFSVDNETPLSILDLVFSDKKITSTPSLVINGENKGELSSEEFKEVICGFYREKPVECNA